jgi:hypothetical protein
MKGFRVLNRPIRVFEREKFDLLPSAQWNVWSRDLAPRLECCSKHTSIPVIALGSRRW